MPPPETAQTADVVAIELIGNLDQFDREVKESARDFGTSMKQIERDAARAEQATGRAARGIGSSFRSSTNSARNLGFQISDIGTQLSAGTSPFIVLAQQGPQVANALEGARGVVGRFAGFLSGPWGAAVLAATTILGGFLFRSRETADSVEDLADKLADQARKTRDAERAQAIFDDTIEGVTQALDENHDALEKLNLAQDTSAEAALKAAEAQRQKTITIREDTVALLENARAAERALIANTGFTGDPVAQEAAVAAASARVSELETLLQTAEIQLNRARAQVVQARSAVIVEQETASGQERINRLYDQRVERARQAAVASGLAEDALRGEIRAIEAARKAELDRYQQSQRQRRETANLPPVTGAEIAAALGTSINSGHRSAAANRAAGGSATSYHLGGPTAAIQAIDIPLTVGGRPLTKAGIRAALEPLGIVIKELLGPGDKDHDDHFHIAFQRRRVGADQIAENIQRAVEQEERRRQAFENELANLLGDESEARQALVTNAAEMARLAADSVEIERKRYNDNLDSLIVQGKLTEQEADELRALNNERANLRQQLIYRVEQERRFREAEAQAQRNLDVASAGRDDAAEVLRGQGDLAETLRERNAIERRLIELQFAEERARNDYLIGYYERLQLQEGITESELAEAKAAADIASLRNQSLDRRRSNATQSVDRNTPLGRYIDDISDIETRAEEAAVRELQAVRDGIVDGLTGELGIKNQYIKDLLAIFLDEVLFRPIAEALQRQRSGGGLLDSVLSALGLLGGSGGGGKIVGLAGGPKGFASGGAFSAGRPILVGEQGPELIMPGQSGMVISNRQLRGGMGGSAGVALVRLELTRDLDARIQRVSGPVAVDVVRAAQPMLTDVAANETARRLGRPSI